MNPEEIRAILKNAANDVLVDAKSEVASVLITPDRQARFLAAQEELEHEEALQWLQLQIESETKEFARELLQATYLLEPEIIEKMEVIALKQRAVIDAYENNQKFRERVLKRFRKEKGS